MMVIGRGGKLQQFLQKPVDGCRCKKIQPSHHMGDTLRRIIDDHGQMVA
jgi:hypothetical protein